MDVLKPRPPIRVHIDELVLHGFSPHERYRVAESIASELHLLVREHGLPGNVAGRDVLRAGSTQVKPENAGARIAAAIYKGLGRE